MDRVLSVHIEGATFLVPDRGLLHSHPCVDLARRRLVKGVTVAGVHLHA